ncbi:MAG: hypothetical protein JOZ49_18355 [Mycolicibacterium sp.]|nr:hypothetical protein [Mycolicibacterium sp.]
MIGALAAAGLMIAVLPPAVAVASPDPSGPGVTHTNPSQPTVQQKLSEKANKANQANHQPSPNAKPPGKR